MFFWEGGNVDPYKYKEYEAWIKRFKTKHNGIENFIKNNLELEEA